MENIEVQAAMMRREEAERAVRHRVMVDSIGGVEELMTRNVGARLAAEYHRLMTSVSHLALGAVWRKA